MVTIFLRIEKSRKSKDDVFELVMRDTNGNSGNNTLITDVLPESKLAWELEKKSGIRELIRIWVSEKYPKGKVFRYEPKGNLTKKRFVVDIANAEPGLKEEYFIKLVTDSGTKISFDPYIRIKPPRP